VYDCVVVEPEIKKGHIAVALDWIGTEGRSRTDTVFPPPDFEYDREHSELYPINHLHRLLLCQPYLNHR
jgi:hypothetical protein